MPVTEAQQRATNKYHRNNIDQYMLKFHKGDREKYAAHAEMMGETLAAFIRRAMEETEKRDRARIRETMKNVPKPAETEEE